MSHDNATEDAWEQRRGDFKGTPLEEGRLLNPSFYTHLLAGCAYDPGEIVGTPAFIEIYTQSAPFRRDLAAHLARVDLEYAPAMNRNCLQTNNADENFMLTIEGELTLCMLWNEVRPAIDRLCSVAFTEICALSPEARRPELEAWLQMVFDQTESYDDGVYWDDAFDE